MSWALWFLPNNISVCLLMNTHLVCITDGVTFHTITLLLTLALS